MTVTAFPAATPAPYVQVETGVIPGGVEFVTAHRTAKGRSFKVRGMVMVAADGASVLDFEAPFNVESSYRFEWFDADGVFVSFSIPETVTLTGISGSEAWVHNPFDPNTSVKVTMLSTAANSLVRPNQGQMFRIPGRSVGVGVFGTRQGLTGTVLDCATETESDADRFDALWGGYDDTDIPILCFRTMPAMRLPAPLFAYIATPEQIPYLRFGVEDVDWRLRGDETAPPAAALVVSLLSYEDFTVFYSALGDGDYDEFTAAYSDYTEASRDYSIAGTA